ncbi:hypothetical protein NPX13_g4316 [Xylaria arbuscula]|uniref:Nudix hydrolase domain-containing protein n=1 Tax=Xylaria arbuscula TaxID=114810 RepID=A0A9W8TNG6_9PEZI|nr:hypothetical protein NPX13_g4316 [Xylaria arbuscula]
MNKETPQWLHEYRQPYLKRKAVECHSGHRHTNNRPGAGLVLVRLNAASQVELLLDLRGPSLPEGGSYGFIGGSASTIGEAPVDTALREAWEEYHIKPKDLNLLGIQWKSDHGGYRYLHYTYVFAEYTPQDCKAPVPRGFESTRSEWFSVNALPSNLIGYVAQDLSTKIASCRHAPQAPPANTCASTKCRVPRPGFKECCSLHASSSGEVKYPKLPTVTVAPPPSPPQSSISADSNGNRYVALTSSGPSETAVAELVYKKLYGDKDFFDLAGSSTPETENKMQAKTTTETTATTNEEKAAEKKTEKPAKKGGFSQFLMSKFLGPSELTKKAGESGKQDNADKPEPKTGMPTQKVTPNPTPEPAMEAATPEKKDEEKKEASEQKEGDEKKGAGQSRSSLFSRFFSATKPAAKPVVAEPVAAETVAAEPVAANPEMKQEIASKPPAAATENPSMEQLSKSLMASTYTMVPPPSGMQNLVPGPAFQAN